MKYSSETEMCKDITELISGILIPRKHKFIPEVPRASHNDHADMLFLFDTGNMFVVEYKLNNPNKLIEQIKRNSFTIGIINQKIHFPYYPVFSYTGEDYEIEKINNFINGKCEFGHNHRKSIGGIESIYYWGYKNTNSSLDGGIRRGKRLSLYKLYRQAIVNLQKEYNWKLDFYLIYKVLGFYEMVTARKHYKEAMKTKLEIKL